MKAAISSIAVVQMASGPILQANLLAAGKLVAQAAAAGARLVVLPENFALMGVRDTDQLRIMETEGSGPIQQFLADAARRYGVWLVGGTLPLATSDPARVREACLVFDDRGERVALYSKIHLFDVRIEEAGESYNESATIQPGDAPVVFESPLGRIGLTVGYDLRFPELFRYLVGLGMEIAVVPSTFTRVTGQAHWEPLLRARAIENLCFLAAAAQGGYHVGGRETWGHSMIVDPWGVIMQRVGNGPGIVLAGIDAERLQRTRRNFPTIRHTRFDCALRP